MTTTQRTRRSKSQPTTKVVVRSQPVTGSGCREGPLRSERSTMLVEHRSVTDPTLIDEPAGSFGRATAIGAVIGCLVVLTIVTGIALAAGAGVVSALGVGAFAALWGGPGWGGMIGAVRHADRVGGDEPAAPPPSRQLPDHHHGEPSPLSDKGSRDAQQG
jgi:hypothetical protein